MFAKIFVQFDMYEWAVSRAKSVNPALPGMPIAPNGWVMSYTTAIGIDKDGNGYAWTLQDVDAEGNVTLHQLAPGWQFSAEGWMLQGNGAPSEFPQPAAPAPAAAPVQLNPPAVMPVLSIVKGAAPAVD